MAKRKIEERDGWLWDRRGNRNEIARYGSRDAAEKALLSLKDCDECVNCSRCAHCARCARCADCVGCLDCLDCLDCLRCSGCSYLCGRRRINETSAGLSGADLSGADLRPIIADYRYILSRAHAEVPALIKALREGRVDGSTYEGECACLVGSLENAGATDLPHNASSPAEGWFIPIRKGIKPGDDSEGGFRSAKALEWAEDYCRDTGIVLPDAETAEA